MVYAPNHQRREAQPAITTAIQRVRQCEWLAALTRWRWTSCGLAAAAGAVRISVATQPRGSSGHSANYSRSVDPAQRRGLNNSPLTKCQRQLSADPWEDDVVPGSSPARRSGPITAARSVWRQCLNGNCRQICRHMRTRHVKFGSESCKMPSHMSGAKGTRTPDPHTASVSLAVHADRSFSVDVPILLRGKVFASQILP